MARRGHGDFRKVRSLETISREVRELAERMGIAPGVLDFTYMFPALADDPGSRLPATNETVAQLKALAETMHDTGSRADPQRRRGSGDSDIPAAYTYLGQFIDHDVTFDETSATVPELAHPDLRPKAVAEVVALKNSRTPRLDLDNLYAGADDSIPSRGLAERDPDDPRKLRIGINVPVGRPVPGKSNRNDLPRRGRSSDKDEDREALIGDPRNDENLIISQLHLAFLKAHNSLVDELGSFEAARRGLRRRYHWMILYDFLPRICDRDVVEDVLQNGPRHFVVEDPDQLAMPVEFAAAAYRFGHSMIRTRYNYNLNFPSADLGVLFTFTALSGNISPDPVPLPGGAGFDTVPQNWVIEWERFLPLNEDGHQRARAIDTRLTEFTRQLRNTFGQPESADHPNDLESQRVAPHLAMRNLLRGYLFGLPTGQAVARAIGAPVLSGRRLLNALPGKDMRTAAEPFAEATPLWFYCLAEAGERRGPKGEHLGPVGSRIVAETFHALISHSEDSILCGDEALDFQSFTLSDLVTLAARQDSVPSDELELTS